MICFNLFLAVSDTPSITPSITPSSTGHNGVCANNFLAQPIASVLKCITVS
jgi:hypothetical protein